MRAAEHPAFRLALAKGLLSHRLLEKHLRPDVSPSAAIELLAAEGALDPRRLARLLAAECGLPFVELATAPAAPEALAALPREFAERYGVFPVALTGSTLRVVVSDPFDCETIDTLGHLTGFTVEPAVAAADDIRAAIRRRYEGRAIAPQSGSGESSGPASGDSEAPVIQLVESVIREAVRCRASDIHFEPLAGRFRIRYRVDGVLREAEGPPRALRRAVVSRLKIMAGLSIAEKRLPQDGRARFDIDGRMIDLRVSSLPTMHGESVVIRLLEKAVLQLDLAELGMSPGDRMAFERVLARPHGLVLVTGPTGSGKTTTLYACLHRLNQPDRKIITVEDPVEYQLAGINQVSVRPETGLTFAAALRAMLRQSPNVVMVGEIRDPETAEIAVNAALTGHLVLSTLHTKDAPGAITRLFDLGAKPFLVFSVLRAVLAQRLVRRACPRCSGSAPAGAPGCPECGGAGYRGRLGLFELLVVDEAVSGHIAAIGGEHGARLAGLARAAGLRSLREDGLAKARAGLTTREEVLAATPRSLSDLPSFQAPAGANGM